MYEYLARKIGLRWSDGEGMLIVHRDQRYVQTRILEHLLCAKTVRVITIAWVRGDPVVVNDRATEPAALLLPGVVTEGWRVVPGARTCDEAHYAALTETGLGAYVRPDPCAYLSYGVGPARDKAEPLVYTPLHAPRDMDEGLPPLVSTRVTAPEPVCWDAARTFSDSMPSADAYDAAHDDGLLMIALDMAGADPQHRTKKQYHIASPAGIVAAVLGPLDRATHPWLWTRENEYRGHYLYESLTWRKTRLFLDIDAHIDANGAPRASASVIVREAVSLIQRLLLREYGVTATDADFLVLDATRADKLSVHVHCPTVVFRTRLDLSLFMILVLEEIVALERAGKETSLVYMHKGLRCFVIDPRVYRTATAYTVSLFRVGVKAPARRGDAEHWLRPAPWWDGWRPTVSDGEAARAEIVFAQLAQAPWRGPTLGCPRTRTSRYERRGNSWGLRMLVDDDLNPDAAQQGRPWVVRNERMKVTDRTSNPLVAHAAAEWRDVWAHIAGATAKITDDGRVLLSLPNNTEAYCTVCDIAHHATIFITIARRGCAWVARQHCFRTPGRSVELHDVNADFATAIEEMVANT